jgi:large subunit ribosomal protein L25
MITLEVKKRDKKEKRVVLQKNGMIPAVFYGRKEKSTPISVVSNDFVKVWKKAGESSIISLKCTGEEDKEVLIQDVDVDPLKGVPRHADFYVIEKGKKLKIKIPIEFSGVAPAVKDFGGTLVKVMHEVEIEALPKDLPQHLIADISLLVTLDSQVLAKDIKLPEGVTLVIKPEEVVASVAEFKEEVEKPAETIDLESIEVEKKGKEVKEGEVPEGEAETRQSAKGDQKAKGDSKTAKT